MRRNPPAAILGLGCLLLAGCSDQTTAPSGTPSDTGPDLAVAPNTWITRRDMWSTERTDFATATIPNAAGQSVVYVIGGRGASNVGLTSVMAYDVATNTWTLRAPLPWPRYAMSGAGVINGKIYVTGGYPYGYSSPRTLMYDPAKNIWAEKSRMPDVEDLQAGGTGVTGVINGKLYVVTEGRCTDTVHEPYMCGELLLRYNPVTDRWAPLALPPQNVTWTTNTYPSWGTNGMGGVIGGKLYVVGTSGGTGRLAVYNPATNTWTEKRGLGQMRYGAASVVHAGKLYLIGGTRLNADGTREVLPANIAYDPAADRWTNYAPLPSARTGIGGSLVTLNGQPRIEVAGGSRPGNNLQYVP